jgi:hypothetical protein
MVDILKQAGTTDWDKERFNMFVNIPASWSAHAMMMQHTVLVSGGGSHRRLSVVFVEVGDENV